MPKHSIKPASAVTPMMAQYLDIKQGYLDCLLFYRMGDFYELFFNDAVKASEALDITLTKRGMYDERDVPMCGVPAHTSETYLSRLIRKGFRVAVCEQMEDPLTAKKRGPKSVVKRAVTRVVTPGTLTEDSLLDARENNYLLAVSEVGGELGLAWVEMSTGEFLTEHTSVQNLGVVVERVQPKEILVPEQLLQREVFENLFKDWAPQLTPQPDSRFNSENSSIRLNKFYSVKSLDGFGNFTRSEISAAGAILDYVTLTQVGEFPRLERLSRVASGSIMEIDVATRRNLELARSLSGDRTGSLLSVIDNTLTGAGARLLSRYLASPLTNVDEIHDRLDVVQYFFENVIVYEDIRKVLRGSPDLERVLTRLILGRAGPRDLAAVRDALFLADRLGTILEKVEGVLPKTLSCALEQLRFGIEIATTLKRALKTELPLLTREGGFIANGYSRKLDSILKLRDDSRRLIATLEGRYRSEIGVLSLKIRHNNVLGYFVELPAAHAPKLTEKFIHRQTLANVIRYSTVELSNLARDIGESTNDALETEVDLFDALVSEVVECSDSIARIAHALAFLDLTVSLAQLAVDRNYCRPLIDNSLAFSVIAGRHAVVEASNMSNADTKFVPNDCNLGPGNRLWLLTGPNMAGKSTFLRQNAIIAIMGQMGSFVPAQSAHIGVVDRLFSRVGAADDIARGRSTFMVEMVETAAILNQAGDRSLIILDEIGRGTATFDGLSIAWASLEHIHEVNQCRALFATHYHELTALTGRLKSLQPRNMGVKEWRGDVVFLHEVVAGTADRSYGVHVAKLAGLPHAVVQRAEEILSTLEEGEHSGAVAQLADDLPLFRVDHDNRSSKRFSELQRILMEIEPDKLTPRAALELIYRMKGLEES